MQTIHVNYSITVSDFRKATYYGLFLRHRRALQIMFPEYFNILRIIPELLIISL